MRPAHASRSNPPQPEFMYATKSMSSPRSSSLLRRRLIPAALALGLACAGLGAAQAALDAGQPAPAVELEAALAGQVFHYSLQEALKQGPVVVYFYPSAYTGGCNIQAHTFATHIDEFKQAGASVVGVSLDSIERLKTFSADPQYCAGKLPVASDLQGNVAKSYALQRAPIDASRRDTRGELIGHDRVERTTFIVAQDGQIRAVIGGVQPEANALKALDVVKSLARPGDAK